MIELEISREDARNKTKEEIKQDLIKQYEKQMPCKEDKHEWNYDKKRRTKTKGSTEKEVPKMFIGLDVSGMLYKFETRQEAEEHFKNYPTDTYQISEKEDD